MDMTEVGLFLLIEVLLSTCDAGRAHHIDKAIGMVIDEPDTLLTRLRSYHHDHPQIIFVGNGFHIIQIIGKGKVGNNHSRHATLHTLLTELLYTVVKNNVQVSHQYERYLHLILDAAQLLKQFRQRHTVLQSYGSCTLDDRTVCQRITERNAYLDHTDATLLQGLDDLGCTFKCGAPSTEIKRQDFLTCFFLLTKEFVDFIHCCINLFHM